MYQPSTDTDRGAQWSNLLNQAVVQPGILLEAYSYFHQYSLGNQILALVQCQQREIPAGPIGTFMHWKERGRFVRKGEKALMLCMPITFKDKANPEERHTGFVYKNRWFVLSQTDGEPVEPIPMPEWSRERAIATLNVEQIPFDHVDGNVQGFARKRSFAVSELAVMPWKTTFHELAHIELGHTTESDFNDEVLTPRSLREAEAESVALILCETLQLPGADACRGYIQNWLRGDVIPEKSAQKIFGAADRILRAGQPQEVRAEA
jgi:hypothetical protein